MNEYISENDMTQYIKEQEICFHKFTVDDCGKLFTWQNRLFRAIRHDAVARVKDIFQNGMLDELIQKEIFVRSWVTDYILDGYGLVVEHEKIAPLVYPYEWSFSMLQDAALAVLQLNQIARQYGYQTKDCHGYNICFHETTPRFIDLGSFEPVDKRSGNWSAYEEFLCFYYYPLRIWSDGNYFFARRALAGYGLNDRMTPENYYLYRFPWLKYLNYSMRRLLILFFVHGMTVTLKPGKFLLFIKQTKWSNISLRDLLFLRSIDFASLARKVQKIAIRKKRTVWGNYHDDYYDHNGNPKRNARFQKIIDIAASLQIKSIVELAGNQGFFCNQLAEQTNIDKIICTDYDENAVDGMYKNAKRKNINIVPAILDFVFPLTNYCNNRPPFDRYKSDAVVALAVTHHLILTQHLSLEYIFANLALFTTRYVFVEFMPLGLHTPDRPVSVPAWYTIDWFSSLFTKFFKILLTEKLEENRILFVGELLDRQKQCSRSYL